MWMSQNSPAELARASQFNAAAEIAIEVVLLGLSGELQPGRCRSRCGAWSYPD